MGLDTGIYLRTNEIRAFTLLDHFTHLLVHSPQSVTFIWSDFPFHRGGHCWFRKVRQKVMSVLCHAAPPSYQFGALLAKVPRHPLAFPQEDQIASFLISFKSHVPLWMLGKSHDQCVSWFSFCMLDSVLPFHSKGCCDN